MPAAQPLEARPPEAAVQRRPSASQAQAAPSLLAARKPCWDRRAAAAPVVVVVVVPRLPAPVPLLAARLAPQPVRPRRPGQAASNPPAARRRDWDRSGATEARAAAEVAARPRPPLPEPVAARMQQPPR